MWHKREPYFQWVDMSKMADLSRLADTVAEWVTNDQGFPHELDGAHLKELVSCGQDEMMWWVFTRVVCPLFIRAKKQERE